MRRKPATTEAGAEHSQTLRRTGDAAIVLLIKPAETPRGRELVRFALEPWIFLSPLARAVLQLRGDVIDRRAPQKVMDEYTEAAHGRWRFIQKPTMTNLMRDDVTQSV